MKPKGLNEIMKFASFITYLSDIREGVQVHGEHYILHAINFVLDFIESSEFKVTKQGIYILNNFKKSLEKTAKDHKLSIDEYGELHDIMNKLMFLISIESKTLFSFYLTEKRINNEKLIFDIGSLFAKEVFSSIPSKIQYDFIECGKCIAFECSTAGAFHVLRGLEGLLRLLLEKLSPQIDATDMAWGKLISELKNLNINDLTTLLDNCDRIRENYRNPTNHPEKIYNIEEIQDLFNLCVGVVNDIVAYMKINSFL